MSKRPLFACLLLILLVGFVPCSAQTTEITYQGQLQNSSALAVGTFDFEFVLYDAPAGGSQVGPLLSRNGISVANGVFSVNLDFGASFPGGGRYLEIHVRPSSGGAFTTLLPRQTITSSPYSIKTLSAETATNAANLGGVPASQYLQTNGNGSGLSNLNAASIATGTLSNARLGQIPTPNIADNAVTAPKIASGQVVKSVNTLKDDITLAGSGNITVTPTGNTLTIASTSGGVGGSGTPNTIARWSGAGTTLADSVITQNGNGVQLPNGVQLAPGTNGNVVQFGSPNSETGMTMSGFAGRSDIRFGGPGAPYLKLLNGPAGSVPPDTNGIIIDTSGIVGIGTTGDGSVTIPSAKLTVEGASSNGRAILGNSINGIGVLGRSTSNVGVAGASTSGTGIFGQSSSGLAGDFSGRVNISGDVGIGTSSPQRLLHVNGRARIGNIPSEASVATVCFNAVGDLLNCASTLRLKTNVQPFLGGLDMVRRLKPITFDWKDGSGHAIGLGAEDVAKVEPYLTFAGSNGEINGVKYDSVGAVLINAVKEQQTQIETQQRQVIQQQKQIAMLLTANAALNTRLQSVERRLPKKHGSVRRGH